MTLSAQTPTMKPLSPKSGNVGRLPDEDFCADLDAVVEVDTSALSRRKHPDETAWPIVSGWLVPWMRKTE